MIVYQQSEIRTRNLLHIHCFLFSPLHLLIKQLKSHTQLPFKTKGLCGFHFRLITNHYKKSSPTSKHYAKIHREWSSTHCNSWHCMEVSGHPDTPWKNPLDYTLDRRLGGAYWSLWRQHKNHPCQESHPSCSAHNKSYFDLSYPNTSAVTVIHRTQHIRWIY
jgi:hypothetical protein